MERRCLVHEDIEGAGATDPIRLSSTSQTHSHIRSPLALRRPSAYFATWKTLFSLGHRPSKFFRGILCLLRAGGIAEEVEKRGINLIHGHFLTAPTETALYLSKLTGIPFGATAYAHDIYVDNSGNATKVRHASYVNATTRYNQSFLAGLVPDHPEKVLTLYYGIHALSMYYAVCGGEAVSCVNVGQEDRNLVRVRFQDGRDLILIVAEKEIMQPGYQICLYGAKGWRSLQPDLKDLYVYLLEQFIRLVRTGEESVPVEEEVEVIAVLEAGKRSLAENREVSLEEVLSS